MFFSSWKVRSIERRRRKIEEAIDTMFAENNIVVSQAKTIKDIVAIPNYNNSVEINIPDYSRLRSRRDKCKV